MSGNPRPPDPWGGDGDWLRRWLEQTEAWFEARIALEASHYKEMAELERQYHFRMRVVIASCVGWVCLGVGTNLGRGDYWNAALYAVCTLAGIPTGKLLVWGIVRLVERAKRRKQAKPVATSPLN